MLEITRLSVHYGKVQALRDISFKVEKGDIFAVLGANGAGKTTLIRTILGLKKQTSGSISFLGEDITAMPAYMRARMAISIVPEGRGLYPDFTVNENLLIGAYQRKDREGIMEDLENVYHLFPVLRDRRNQVSKTLSGGEGQMLAIGRGLMARPKLILMDEPSMGIMPVVVTEIFKVIKNMPARGVTVLLVEQNAKKALSVANKAAVLEVGRMILGGDAKSLRDDPKVKKAYLGG